MFTPLVIATLSPLALSAAPASSPAEPLSALRMMTVAQAPDLGRGSLAAARRLADDLRYEEAIVEYQRYLGVTGQPAPERARALLELGFLHLLLDDPVNAEKRGLEAMTLDVSVQAPANAPAKQVSFVEQVRRAFQARPRLAILSREGVDRPEAVSVQVNDPQKKTRAIVLRHGLGSTGPFYSSTMTCTEAGVCTGFIAPPNDVTSYTAWYFIEAQDFDGTPLARAGSPEAPLQLAIVQRTPWYRSPYIYAGGAALLIGAGAVFFAASAPTSSR